MRVLIPMHPEFDGFFKSPCVAESGVSSLGLYDEEEEKEARLLNKPVEEASFILVPCGFFEENHSVDPSLN